MYYLGFGLEDELRADHNHIDITQWKSMFDFCQEHQGMGVEDFGFGF